MKAITLLLEEDEVLILRMQARMMQLMLEETNEQLESYMKKILDATNDVNDNTRKEIGIVQRAMRRVKKTEQYGEFMVKFKVVEALLIKEVEKEKSENEIAYEASTAFPDFEIVGDGSLVGLNYNNPAIEVKHSELQRIDSDSPHKSACPVCKEGFLLMERHETTMLLKNRDMCILCGQAFIYTDIPDNKLMSLFYKK